MGCVCVGREGGSERERERERDKLFVILFSNSILSHYMRIHDNNDSRAGERRNICIYFGLSTEINLFLVGL
jgi:hypothetical protein